MRILRSIFSSLLMLGIVTAVIFFLGREVLIQQATSQISSRVTELRGLSREYQSRCLQRGASGLGAAISTVQLRFIDNRTYNIEIICSQFALDPIVVSSEELPFMVVKQAGNTGFVWSPVAEEMRGGVVLSLFGRSKPLGPDGSGASQAGADSAQFSIGPTSSCSGYGYACCNLDTQIGDGDSFTQVTDCPRSCYASCLERPVVLSFTTDPFLEPESRVTTVQPGQMVTFNWVTEIPTDTAEITIDYGDGTTEAFSAETEQTTHTYNCRADIPSCRFTVSLQIEASDGRVSNQTAISQLVVLVQSR